MIFAIVYIPVFYLLFGWNTRRSIPSGFIEVKEGVEWSLNLRVHNTNVLGRIRKNKSRGEMTR